MNKTNIEWATLSANPLKYRRKSDGKVVWACVKTSPGCAHCYAESIALRFDRGRLFSAKNMEEVEPFLDEKELQKILTAKTIGGVPVSGSKCFLGDMTDVFGEWVPDALLDRLFAVMACRRDVTFQILTKRAERMAEYFESRSKSAKFWKDAANSFGYSLEFQGISLVPFPLPNLWLGVSVENQEQANKRIPHLLKVPAAVRFLSVEPMLGPVELRRIPVPTYPGVKFDSLLTRGKGAWGTGARIDWVVCGGESGHGARPCNVEWIRSIVRQCREAGVACFAKQLGSRPVESLATFDFKRWPAETAWGERDGVASIFVDDPKGGDMSEWPEDLRVREFPQ